VIKNLGEALEGLLARHLAAHRSSLAKNASATPLGSVPSKQPPKLSPKEIELSQAKREERLARYEQVVALHKLGLSQTAIANQVGISHATVSRWLHSSAFPEQQPRPRRVHLDPHLSLYVNIEPSPLDTGPVPGVHWRVWIVELAGERLFSPHGLTD